MLRAGACPNDSVSLYYRCTAEGWSFSKPLCFLRTLSDCAEGWCFSRPLRYILFYLDWAVGWCFSKPFCCFPTSFVWLCFSKPLRFEICVSVGWPFSKPHYYTLPAGHICRGIRFADCVSAFLVPSIRVCESFWQGTFVSCATFAPGCARTPFPQGTDGQ